MPMDPNSSAMDNLAVQGRRPYKLEAGVTSSMQDLSLSSSSQQQNPGTRAPDQSPEGKEQAGRDRIPQDKRLTDTPMTQTTQRHTAGDLLSNESLSGFELHQHSAAEGAETAEERTLDQLPSEAAAAATAAADPGLIPTTILSVNVTGDGGEPTLDFPHQESTETRTKHSDAKSSTEKKRGEEESSGSGPWVPSNVPKLKQILPSSSNSSGSWVVGSGSETESGTGSDASREGKKREGGGVELTEGSSENLDVKAAQRPVARVQDSLQNLLRGSVGDLQDYLINILNNQPDFGYYVLENLQPTCVEGVWCYRLGVEFEKLETLHQVESNCGVFKCRDKATGQMFIWKRVRKERRRLLGIEFLVQHRHQHFLPRIYGVHKDKNTISIFEEYIEGGTLRDVNWNLSQIRQFAEILLKCIHYLHSHDLVHADIKTKNLMVRRNSKPESLVQIDFESAKQSVGPYYRGGHTLNYLPPWHRHVTGLESYHPVLKTLDLWAAACVILYFLLPGERSGVRDVWSEVIADYKQACGECREEAGCCPDCRKKFLDYLEERGHQILDHHLGVMIDRIDNPNWKALMKLLRYLTDVSNVHSMTITEALDMIRDPKYAQPAIEYDFAVSEG